MLSGLRLLLVALAALLSSCTPHDGAREGRTGMDRIRAAGVLRWGADIQGGEPYVYRDPASPDRLVGFEVDLADALARELGVRAEVVQTDWATLIPSLERSDFDVVLNGLEITDARLGRVLFTRPYYVFAERLVARKDDATVAPELERLRGRRVGTLANSLAFDRLRTVTEPVVYDGVEEPYRDLESGRIDAVLLDDIIARRYAETNPSLRTVGDLGEGRYAIGVRLDEPDVKGALDTALARITASGELQRILEKHRLWNDRQAHLLEAAQGGAPEAPKAVAAAATFEGEHVLLFLKAAGVTLVVSSLAMVLAVALGLGLALARMFGRPALARAASVYVEVYRGTPILLQLYLLYFGLAHVVRLGAFPAAVIGLGMNYAAYEAEAYRAGLQAVPKAQMEAALALGMSLPVALRRIILPQAMRFAIPNVTNDFIALLKDSSLVSAITVVELTKQMTITAVDVRSWLVPGLVCAAFYFAMSYPLGVAARRLERRLEGERS